MQCARCGIHALRAFRAQCLCIVRVAPIIDVVAEEVGAHSEFSHAPEHRDVNQLSVLQRMPVTLARMRRQHLRDRFDRNLGSLVAIGVHMNLKALAVIARNLAGDFRRR
jgi:hypothetical protein